MIKEITRSFLINIFALWVTAAYITGFELSEGLRSLLIVGAGFTALHLILKPALSVVTGPLNFLTLGLIGLVIDAIILYILTLYFPQITINPWFFPGWSFDGFTVPSYEFNKLGATVISAFVINLIRSALRTLA